MKDLLETNIFKKEDSSFRDPCSYIFTHNNEYYRYIDVLYSKQYDHLMQSGLYKSLMTDSLLISHEEVSMVGCENAYSVLKPQFVPFISYPYEWCFSQLVDAALVTLECNKRALEYDMILKDASAYNIQFVNGRAVLIDTASFEFYKEGTPWIAYGQFCRHFLSPLFLMANIDIRLSQLLRVYIDGIPLDLASTLLNKKGGFAARQHIRWHSRATQKYSGSSDKDNQRKNRQIAISRFQYAALIDSLIRIVQNISLRDSIETEWGNYYSNTNYDEESSTCKATIITEFLQKIRPLTLWDIGANDGTYSRLASGIGAYVIAFDIDPIAVEKNYRHTKDSHENILPLILDLTNPSPSIGFANRERKDIQSRQKPDCIMMLAFIHHMAISNNIPLYNFAKWLCKLSSYLIIEFVPKEDSQVKRLLLTRDDIFTDYNQDGFENAFSHFFIIVNKRPIDNSLRTLYLLKSKDS